MVYPPVSKLHRAYVWSLLLNGLNQPERNTQMFHRRRCVGFIVELDVSFETGKWATFCGTCIQRGYRNCIVDWISRFIGFKRSKSLLDPLMEIALSIKNSKMNWPFSSQPYAVVYLNSCQTKPVLVLVCCHRADWQFPTLLLLGVAFYLLCDSFQRSAPFHCGRFRGWVCLSPHQNDIQHQSPLIQMFLAKIRALHHEEHRTGWFNISIVTIEYLQNRSGNL